MARFLQDEIRVYIKNDNIRRANTGFDSYHTALNFDLSNVHELGISSD